MISSGPLIYLIKCPLNCTLKPSKIELLELEKQEQAKLQDLHRKCFAAMVLSFKPEIENTDILVDECLRLLSSVGLAQCQLEAKVVGSCCLVSQLVLLSLIPSLSPHFFCLAY